MKNWIVILLIFIIPLGLYAFLDAEAQNEKMCTLQEENINLNNGAKLIKFSSPMCSECKQVSEELSKVAKDIKSKITIEEINVLDNSKAAADYNKKLIKKYKVTLTPTLIFVDKNGKIVHRQESVMKAEEIEKIINKISSME